MLSTWRDVLVWYKAEVGGSKKRGSLWHIFFLHWSLKGEGVSQAKRVRSLLAQAHSVRKGSEVEPTLQLEQRGPRGRLVRSDLSHCMKNRRIPPPLPHREHLCPLCCQMPWKPYFLPLTHSLTLCNLTATSTQSGWDLFFEVTSDFLLSYLDLFSVLVS